jgi:hypothetical protein
MGINRINPVSFQNPVSFPRRPVALNAERAEEEKRGLIR